MSFVDFEVGDDINDTSIGYEGYNYVEVSAVQSVLFELNYPDPYGPISGKTPRLLPLGYSITEGVQDSSGNGYRRYWATPLGSFC